MLVRKPKSKSASIIIYDKYTPGTFIICVEGVTDEIYFKDFLMKSIPYCKFKIEVCKGKIKVLQLVKELNKKRFSRFLGIIDSDFDKLLNIRYNNPRIIQSSYRDVENNLFRSGAFDKFESLLLNSDKLNSYLIKCKLFDLISSQVQKIGILRFINDKHKFGWDFKGLDFEKFFYITSDKIIIDDGLLLNHLLNIKNVHGITKDKINEYKKEYLEKLFIHNNSNLPFLWHGKDIMTTLYRIHRKFGNPFLKDDKLVYESLLFRSLVGYFELEWFKSTQEFIKIEQQIKSE